MNHIILFLLGLNQVFSWDMGILYNDKIELYDKQRINKTISDIAFKNMYILTPSYKRESFSFFTGRYNHSFLLTYRPEYDRYDLDGKVEKEDSIQSMDIDVNKNLLFWLDVNKNGLFKLEIKIGQENKAGILLTYFTHKIVRDIVVNDVNETIYWIASNVSQSFLIRTNYIGFEQDVLVVQKGTISFLTIDKEEGFLYWVHDMGNSYDIEKYNINTGEIQVVKKNLQNQPCHLKTSKKYLFWMDWKTRYIWKTEKNNDFMETYLSFDDNAVSFVINENTIDNETVSEKIIFSIERVDGDMIIVETLDDSKEIDNKELNKTHYKICFKSQSDDDKLKKAALWFIFIITMCIIFVLILLFISNKVSGKRFYGLLNTHPLNDIQV